MLPSNIITTAEYGPKVLLKKRNHQILLYAAGPNIAIIEIFALWAPVLCRTKRIRKTGLTIKIYAGIFRTISGIVPELLTFRKPNSMKYIKSIDREYHAKKTIIDLYIFFHILNRRRRLDLPGNLAEIS